MAAWRSTREQNTSRRLVSWAKKPSTALSQEADVGVYWNTKRGCRSSQARTLGCLWLPCFVAQQTLDPRAHKPFLPAPNRYFACACLTHDLVGAG
jgi:hypothetical protein